MTTFRRAVIVLTMANALIAGVGNRATAQDMYAISLKRAVCVAGCVAGTAACCATLPEHCGACIDVGNACIDFCPE
jgi:hypothetical protein